MVFLFGLRFSNSLEVARTMAFTNLVMAQLFFVFSCRSEDYSVFTINPFSNLYLLVAVAFSFMMHIMILYYPFFQRIFNTTLLSKGEWSFIILVAGGSTLIIEVLQLLINIVERKVSFNTEIEEGIR